ncbi:DUF751 family protein [Microcoleus sp. FACHB-1515]|uniref:DUF751 family protein n=1 Tax=Cyanophyceae TaxID=3028117 RepID=UPI0016885A1F|nr:DUF751 family protein [Microcoleus sp. FACHB-1515]MBD2091012.1 DUF751 family protein [Microcoleus sp. FACHB-1515]
MQDFLENVSRYPRYLVSITLGVLLTALSPLVPLFRRPSTAIATICLLIAGLMAIGFTLRAMLGFSA